MAEEFWGGVPAELWVGGTGGCYILVELWGGIPVELSDVITPA